MRNTLSQDFMDPQADALLAPVVISKFLRRCYFAVDMLVTRMQQAMKAGYIAMPDEVMTSVTDMSSDEYDWRLNELSCSNCHHSLPLRTWKRHSAVLTLAREISTQSRPVKDTSAT